MDIKKIIRQEINSILQASDKKPVNEELSVKNGKVTGKLPVNSESYFDIKGDVWTLCENNIPVHNGSVKYTPDNLIKFGKRVWNVGNKKTDFGWSTLDGRDQHYVASSLTKYKKLHSTVKEDMHLKLKEFVKNRFDAVLGEVK